MTDTPLKCRARSRSAAHRHHQDPDVAILRHPDSVEVPAALSLRDQATAEPAGAVRLPAITTTQVLYTARRAGADVPV